MTTLLAAAASALVAGVALAQDADGMAGTSAAGFDADGDARISRDEFQTGFHQEWRRNAGDDGPMDRETFESSILGDAEDFAAFDSNDDGLLTEEEYAEGVFAEYDGDGDGLLDRDDIAEFGDSRGGNGASAR